MLITVDMNRSDISKNAVPQDVEGMLRLEEWADIAEAFDQSNDDGHSSACFLELIVCVLFAFPLIFCCHFCLATSRALSVLDT